ncbi:peptidase family C78-domain-containing protein [Xylariomycetidae sp. FL0641]|nr:peptidase family C78-domain-containing protein [Xylariomycetidae sp. FL0641]
MPDRRIMTCPLCGFAYKPEDEYAILLHMERQHPEGVSPFIPANHPDPHREPAAAPKRSSGGSGGDDEEQFVACPVEGCGENVMLAELEYHIELHATADDQDAASSSSNAGSPAPGTGRGVERGYRSPYALPPPPPHHAPARQGGKQEGGGGGGGGGAADAWKKILHMPQARHPNTPQEQQQQPMEGAPPKKRLGKSELGKYAHESKMPDWLVTMLKKGGYVSAEGVVQVLEQLLDQSASTQYAYLCHSAVQHVSKLRREGGFCGYRNIQMLASYVVGSGAPGAEIFRGKVPSIFRIQDYIENAWDMGINAQGRIETGGVRGTRKYIGTPEAQAMFLSLNIPCEAQGFKSQEPGVAEAQLFSSVETYFETSQYDRQAKVRRTSRPPIYFQHRGHSLTIVGFERHLDGTMELLVFDPMFPDPDTVTRHLGRRFTSKSPDKTLKLYRRGNKYLRKYHEFEVLRLKG